MDEVSRWGFEMARAFARGIIGGPTGRKGGGVARFFRDRGGWGCGRACGCVRVARAPLSGQLWPVSVDLLGLCMACAWVSDTM